MTELEKLKARLLEAEDALHTFSISPQRTQIAWSLGGQNSKSQLPVDPMKLQAYVDRLKMDIARLENRGRMGVGTEW